MISGKKYYYRVTFVTKKDGYREWAIDLEAPNLVTAIRDAKSLWVGAGFTCHQFNPHARRLTDSDRVLCKEFTEVNNRWSLVSGSLIQFESADKMMETLHHYGALYNIDTDDYVFIYNDCGSIAVYDIEPTEAIDLQRQGWEAGEYWGAFLGVGGWIYDDESYKGRKEETPTNKDYCADHYNKGRWLIV